MTFLALIVGVCLGGLVLLYIYRKKRHLFVETIDQVRDRLADLSDVEVTRFEYPESMDLGDGLVLAETELEWADVTMEISYSAEGRPLLDHIEAILRPPLGGIRSITLVSVDRYIDRGKHLYMRQTVEDKLAEETFRQIPPDELFDWAEVEDVDLVSSDEIRVKLSARDQESPTAWLNFEVDEQMIGLLIKSEELRSFFPNRVVESKFESLRGKHHVND